MTALHLGVTDVAYANNPKETTGTVARILEDDYHVMAAFYRRRRDKVNEAVANSYAGAIETMFQGGPVVENPLAAATGGIETSFRQFLLSGEIETMGIEGVPTQAALNRKSKRFKSGTAPAQRPSFIDTGLYERSFRAWAD
jgi:hypothetical protein